MKARRSGRSKATRRKNNKRNRYGIDCGCIERGGRHAGQPVERVFYVDSLPDNVLATKAEKQVKARFGGSRREDNNVILDGSVIDVADGQ